MDVSEVRDRVDVDYAILVDYEEAISVVVGMAVSVAVVGMAVGIVCD